MCNIVVLVHDPSSIFSLLANIVIVTAIALYSFPLVKLFFSSGKGHTQDGVFVESFSDLPVLLPATS